MSSPSENIHAMDHGAMEELLEAAFLNNFTWIIFPMIPCAGALIVLTLPLCSHARSFPETTTNRLLVLQLEHVLATCNRRFAEPSWSSSGSNPSTLPNNRSLNKIASCKILRHCTKDDRIQNWECVESIEVEALAPLVFGWLGKHGNVGLMYNVIREMPWLVSRKVENTI